MKFYNKYFKSNYEELITYYPRFYIGVYEMAEILKAHGGIADELEKNIEQTYMNSFIDYADEGTIEKLEKFLMIKLNKSRTIEERRRFVKSCFVGSGKASASMISEMIQSYTGANVDISLEPFDSSGNNALFVNFQRGSEPTLYMDDISSLLSKKIPAHIKWQAAVTYCFPTGIGIRRKYFRYGYELCGIAPENANETSLFASNSAIGVAKKNYVNTYKSSGLYRSKEGIINEIDAEKEVHTSNFSVDYIYCGTKYAQR